MNIVAYTAGVSKNKGYSYRTSGCEESVDYEFGKVMDGNSEGIAVKKENDNFSVSIRCIPTAQVDFSSPPRSIVVHLTLTGLTEAKARGLLRFYLDNIDKNWETGTAPLTNAFAWSEQDEQGWTVNFAELKRGIERIVADSVPNTQFSDRDRWEQENTEATRRELSETLTRRRFSQSNGFKIVISSGSAPTSDGYKRLQKEVDRYLWMGCQKRINLVETTAMQKKTANITQITAAITAILLITCLLWSNHSLKNAWKELKGKNNILETQIQQLEKDNSKLKKKLEEAEIKVLEIQKQNEKKTE